MKTLVLLALSITLLAGCVSVPNLVKALGNDPASSHVTVRSIYFTIEVDRANPGANTQPHVISDGKITVTERTPETVSTNSEPLFKLHTSPTLQRIQ